MQHAPEDYGAYWSAAIRLAIGVLVVVGVYRAVGPLLGHAEWPAQVLGWIVLGLSVFVGAFVVAIAMGHIVRTAVTAEQS